MREQPEFGINNTQRIGQHTLSRHIVKIHNNIIRSMLTLFQPTSRLYIFTLVMPQSTRSSRAPNRVKKSLPQRLGDNFDASYSWPSQPLRPTCKPDLIHPPKDMHPFAKQS